MEAWTAGTPGRRAAGPSISRILVLRRSPDPVSGSAGEVQNPPGAGEDGIRATPSGGRFAAEDYSIPLSVRIPPGTAGAAIVNLPEARRGSPTANDWADGGRGVGPAGRGERAVPS